MNWILCFAAFFTATLVFADRINEDSSSEEQVPTGPTKRRCTTDLMVIVDNSGSVRGVFDHEKEIAASLVDALHVSPHFARVAMMQFSSRASLVFPFERFGTREAIAEAIREVQQVGFLTRTVLALRLANEDFTAHARPEANKIILIITDGHSQNTPAELEEAAAALNRTGVWVYVATASDAPDVFEMDIYTARHRDRIFLHNNITQMPSLIARFIESGNCLPEETPGTADHPSELVVRPPPVEKEVELCLPFSDLIVVIDNSESVDTVFQREKEVAAILIGTLNVGPSQSRVAIITYNDDAKLFYSFDDAATKEAVSEALRNLPQFGGNTNTLAALEMAHKELKESTRTDARKMILLVTDGYSFNTVESLKEIVKKLKHIGVSIWVATASDNFGVFEFNLFVQQRYDHLFLKNNISEIVPVITKLVSCKIVDVKGQPLDGATTTSPTIASSFVIGSIPDPATTTPTDQNNTSIALNDAVVNASVVNSATENVSLFKIPSNFSLISTKQLLNSSNTEPLTIENTIDRQ